MLLPFVVGLALCLSRSSNYHDLTAVSLCPTPTYGINIVEARALEYGEMQC